MLSERTLARRALAAALLILGLPAAPSLAEPLPVPATVVWTRDSRVYVALRDSGALEPGMLVTFFERKRALATGEVTNVHDGDLAVVRLATGSLAKTKRLDRLTIRAERPAVASRSRLRVGGPSERRTHLLLKCARVSVIPPEGYAVDSTVGGAWRLLRAFPSPPSPDTLVVVRFDDAVDEEIALERGEIDVAVFWPGEMSEHLRESPRWNSVASGGRPRRGILLSWLGDPVDADSASRAIDTAGLTALSDQLFRGDLARGFAGDPIARPMRVVVDTALPGHRALQRYFDRRVPVRTTPVPTFRLTYSELGDYESAPLELRYRVVFDAALRPYVKQLGGNVLTEMFVCEASRASR